MNAQALVAAAVALTLATASATQAAVTPFDLLGRAGAGLLSGNEIGAIAGNPGTGGELGAGILFDDVSKVLSINVGWGSNAGFLGTLTGTVTGMHLHGAADINNNAPVVVGLDGLPGFNNAANGGGFNGSVVLSATNEARLLSGLLYINVHTGTAGGGLNGNGEIRGNLFAVPEPTAAVLVGLGLCALGRRRR